MGQAFKKINWPTFVITLLITISGGILSYANAISEIKQQIATSQVKEQFLAEAIIQIREDMKNQRKEILEVLKASKEEMDEIKNLLLTKRQIDDLKSLVLGVSSRRGR